ncbi:MAG: tetratricopeptide repeat protein [Armatimonadota bacterium]|nr:tetratricopeptide repeat protein [Armatimonadota bacterium]MDR7450156.1 tetratricopeptide repeat protein [Armatimonadota bacterium]MDR7479731.1 tetratricopeptide repeat protein [Armatimonadota bacterium]MDR7489644.1 tetratricopeptide repeat protein [Armatimonadota bacterium]MDR7492482.1 tetratricopeptide repeat protein [Armatimonadota bacterium]
MTRLCVVLLVGLLLVLALPAQGATPLEEGIALYQAGRYADAAAVLARAVRQHPNDARAWTWLGAARLQLGQLGPAVQALRRALTLAPRFVPARFYLGVAYARQRDEVRARVAFERVRREAPGTGYAEAAAAWLRRLSGAPGASSTPGGPGAPPASPPPDRACPPAAPLPTPRMPPPPAPSPAPLEVVSLEARLEGEELVVDGEVENTGDDPAEVRLEVVGFGVDGRVLVRTAVAVQGPVEPDDVGGFRARLGTTPPVFWVQAQVLAPAPGAGHSALAPVDPQLYLGLARRRVQVTGSLVPAGRAAAHLLCLRISDAAGFPIASVRARVLATGIGDRIRLQQMRVVEVPPAGTTVRVTWPQPAAPSVRMLVEGVRLAPLPSIRP